MLSNDRSRVCGFTLPDSGGYAAEFPQKFGSRLRRRMRPAASAYVRSPETWAFQKVRYSHEQKREGWTREIQNAKALVKREDSALAVTPVEAVAATLAERGQRNLKRMAGVSERGVDHIETMDGPEILNSVDQIEKLDKVPAAPSNWTIFHQAVNSRLTIFVLTRLTWRYGTSHSASISVQSFAISRSLAKSGQSRCAEF